MQEESMSPRLMSLARVVVLSAVFLAVPMTYARSCIVNAGTQNYETSSASSAEKTIVAARTTTVNLSAEATETRRRTVAFSSAGALNTLPCGSVLILR